MSDLTHIGDVLVTAQAKSLPLDASAAELRARHLALQEDFKRHRDEETLALQMAWLCLIAIERVRQMEESHAGADRDRSDDGRADLGPRPAVARRPGGGWISPTEPAAPSSRPH